MNADFALIDSNLERALEGLRVLDEMARFVLINDSSFARLKTLRHEVAALGEIFGSIHLLMARGGNEAATIDLPSENKRHSSWAIIRANCNRAAESLRTLEEFSKLYAPSITAEIKNKRYELYQLELGLLRNTPHYFLRKYFSEGVVYPLSESVEELQWLVEHGAKIIQLRDKSDNKNSIKQKARSLASFLAEWNQSHRDKVLFILNDHPAIAADLPVDGVHIGQNDCTVAEARQLLGSNKIIGRSNNSLEQLRESIKLGADYVSIGPVFATPTKPDRLAVGLETVKAVAKEITAPWLAIGGVDSETIKNIRQAGGKNVAVVRAARTFFKQ